MADLSRHIKNTNPTSVQWAAGGIGKAPLADNMKEFDKPIIAVNIQSGKVNVSRLNEVNSIGYIKGA